MYGNIFFSNLDGEYLFISFEMKCGSLVLKITFDCAHEKRTLMANFWHFHFFKEFDQTKSEKGKSEISLLYSSYK